MLMRWLYQKSALLDVQGVDITYKFRPQKHWLFMYIVSDLQAFFLLLLKKSKHQEAQ